MTGPDPVVVALRDLSSKDGRVRAACADVLGQLLAAGRSERRAEIVEALLSSLKDREPLVRYNAALSLAEARAAEGLAALTAQLDDPDPLARQGAAVALGELGDVAAAPALEEALKSGPPEVRFQAVASLARLRREAALPLLRAALTDPDGEVRAQAAACLGDLGDEASREALARMRNDLAEGARFESALALSRLGDARAAETLLAFVRHREHALAAIEALGRLKSRAALPELLKLARGFFTAAPVRIRAAAAALAIDPGAAAEREFLLKQARRRRPETRGLAIECLGELAAPFAVEELTRQLADLKDPFSPELAQALAAARRRAPGLARELLASAEAALRKVAAESEDAEARAEAEAALRPPEPAG